MRRVNAAAEAFVRCGWEPDVVVCDNNSTDRTAEIARAAGARVVFEPFNQIARARNAGAREAHGDWLIFIDADSWSSAELFSDLTLWRGVHWLDSRLAGQQIPSVARPDPV